MNRIFLTVVPILLIIILFNAINKSKDENKKEEIEVASAKSYPTYTINDIKNPSEHYTIIKVLLNDQDIRVKSSYSGLGRSICKLNSDTKLLCDVIFTSEKFKDAFDTPNPDFSNEVFDYVSAKYNSSSGRTLYSCFYIEGALSSDCSKTMGNKLVVENDNIPNFDYSSILLTRETFGERIYTNKKGTDFNIRYHEPKVNKLTDDVERLAMYSMKLASFYDKRIDVSCVKGSAPVMRFDGEFADKESNNDLDLDLEEFNRVVTYRLDKNRPETIKQSLNSYLITHSVLSGYDVILSPSETDDFMTKISKGNTLIVGKYHKKNNAGVTWAQREVKLKGLAKSWNQLKAMCKNK